MYKKWGIGMESDVLGLFEDVNAIFDKQTKFNRMISNHLFQTIVFTALLITALSAVAFTVGRNTRNALDERITELERCSDRDQAAISDLQLWQLDTLEAQCVTK